jgi:hypothetical protein
MRPIAGASRKKTSPIPTARPVTLVGLGNHAAIANAIKANAIIRPMIAIS